MLVKLIHVISSAVLFCGVLSASLFFTLAFRRGGPEIITAMARFCRTGAIVTAVGHGGSAAHRRHPDRDRRKTRRTSPG